MNDSNADRRKLLQDGINAVRARQLAEGRTLLQRVIAGDPNNEMAWLWLAAAVENPAERQAALIRVLQINPNNPSARKALDRLRAEAERPAPPVTPPTPATSATSATSAPLRNLGAPPATELPAPSQRPADQSLNLFPPPAAPALSAPPAAARRLPPGLIILLIGAVIAIIAIVAIFFRGTGELPNLNGVATTNPNLSFIAVQQTRDALTQVSGLVIGQAGTSTAQSLPPTWTVAPTQTLPPTATIPASATFFTSTPLPTVATPTPLASPTLFASPTITTTPPTSSALRVLFAQESKAHPAIRALAQTNVGDTQASPLTDGSTSAADPARSPDDRQLAYVALVNGTPQLAIANVDGSHAQIVTTLTGSYLRSPRWSPDGTQIAFAASRPGTTDGSTGLYLLQISDRSIRALTDAQAHTTPFIHDPSWSPDGKTIVFAAGISRAAAFQIEAVTVANSQVNPITGGTLSAVEPAWSPDGTQIAFVTLASGSHAALMIMNADGTGIRSLTGDRTDADYHSPAWSPDGHWLAFSANRDGGFAIYVGLVTPGALVNLTRLTDPAQPAFTPGFAHDALPAAVPPTTQAATTQTAISQF